MMIIFTFKADEELFNDGLIFMEDAFVVSEETDMMIEAGALLTESEHVRPCMGGGEDDRVGRTDQADGACFVFSK